MDLTTSQTIGNEIRYIELVVFRLGIKIVHNVSQRKPEFPFTAVSSFR